MKFSQYFAPTLKEDPAEAEVVSHRLMVRAGMIRKLTSGIYSFLPLGYKAVNKAIQIIRQELDSAGCQEIFMPMVQPSGLWNETGRWDLYGKELLRLKDRHDRDYCLGPTHEEVITDLIRGEVRSYRQLPFNLYQIQTKFRDEIRPRFGLMRCREFIMKDGYSFHKNDQEAQASYDQMFETYNSIFKRMGLEFNAVEADTGAIGGKNSHEFMVLADTGEDTLVVCKSCGYAANLEKANLPQPEEYSGESCPDPELVDTPDMHTVEDVAKFLRISPAKVVKTLLYEADGAPVAALVPGDRVLNEVKLKNHLHAQDLKLASPEQIQRWSGAPMGFSGPKDLNIDRIVADNHLLTQTDWITGANQDNAHFLHIDLQRDSRVAAFTDLAEAQESDPCPKCRNPLQFQKGIEVGHIFQLGNKYSSAMQATYLDEQGQEQEIQMGCYGIGVTRVVAAAIEQNHDKDGIIFPPPLAPFEVSILALNTRDESVMQEAESIYRYLQQENMDVIFDDRDERPGVKFKDADLMGFPMQVIVGGKGLQNREIEVKDRRTGDKEKLPLSDFIAEFKKWREKVRKQWAL
ncbi:MAG: proline--tRNA ligase [Thermodesulfobacteriota bacterium]